MASIVLGIVNEIPLTINTDGTINITSILIDATSASKSVQLSLLDPVTESVLASSIITGGTSLSLTAIPIGIKFTTGVFTRPSDGALITLPLTPKYRFDGI